MTDAGRSPQPRRMVLRLADLALAALVAGCQVVPRGAPRPIEPPPPPPVVERPVTPQLPEDDQRQRVALLVPLTGENAGVGQALANATTLALIDTRSARIRITTYDTAAGPEVAARKAIADGNRLILGPLLAEDVRRVAPVARGAGVPLISFSNDIGVAGDGTYLLGYAPAQSIERVVGYAHDRGVNSFAGLYRPGPFGQRVSTAFIRAVEDAGGKVVALQSFDGSAKSLPAAVAKLAQAGPFDAVLLATDGRAAATAVALIRRGAAPQARVLGTDQWNTDTSLGGNPALHGAWFASVSDALYGQFAAKYRARFGRSPYRIATLGYDAVLLTVRAAADWPISAAFPVKMLSDRDGFVGIDGAFRFGRDGVAERALEVQQVAAGGPTVVSPAPRGFGSR